MRFVIRKRGRRSSRSFGDHSPFAVDPRAAVSRLGKHGSAYADPLGSVKDRTRPSTTRFDEARCCGRSEAGRSRQGGACHIPNPHQPRSNAPRPPPTPFPPRGNRPLPPAWSRFPRSERPHALCIVWVASVQEAPTHLHDRSCFGANASCQARDHACLRSSVVLPSAWRLLHSFKSLLADRLDPLPPVPPTPHNPKRPISTCSTPSMQPRRPPSRRNPPREALPGLFDELRIAQFIELGSSPWLVRVPGWTAPGGAWGNAPAKRRQDEIHAPRMGGPAGAVRTSSW